jgi:hypothetical protein
MEATKCGDAGAVESILRQARGNYTRNLGGASRWATMSGNRDIVRRLLDAGSRVKVVGFGGCTPLTAAAERGYDD